MRLACLILLIGNVMAWQSISLFRNQAWRCTALCRTVGVSTRALSMQSSTQSAAASDTTKIRKLKGVPVLPSSMNLVSKANKIAENVRTTVVHELHRCLCIHWADAIQPQDQKCETESHQAICCQMRRVNEGVADPCIS